MAALLAAGLLPLVASAGLALGFQDGVRVEVRTQQLRPAAADQPVTATQGLEVEPRAALELSSPGLRLELAYQPRYTHLWGDGPDRDTWLHRFSATAGWRPSATWQLGLDGVSTFGTLDLFRLATVTSVTEPTPAPVASTMAYQREQLAVTADGHLGGRQLLGGRLVAWREEGGTAAARQLLPLQQGAQLRGELGWQATRHLTLAGAASAELTRLIDAPVAVAAPGGLDHRSWTDRTERVDAIVRLELSRETRAWAGAGLAVVEDGAPGAGGPALRPVGEVGIESRAAPGAPSPSGPVPPSLSGGAVLAAAPIEDRLTGLVAPRADLRAWVTWVPAERWSLGASGSAGRVLEGTTARDSFASGELRLAWAVRDAVVLVAGARGTSEWAPRLQVRPTSEWVVLLAVELAHRGRL